MPTPTLGAITVYGTYPPEPPSWGGGLGSGLWDGIGWSHFSTPRIVPAWYIAQILNQKEAYYFSHYSQESRYYHDPQTTRGMVEPLVNKDVYKRQHYGIEYFTDRASSSRRWNNQGREV